MKNRLLFLLFIGFALGNSVTAQVVGGSVFLQGKWLEVGVAPNGSWGNNAVAPAGYHTGLGIGSAYPGSPGGMAGLDFSYDAGHDGWGVAGVGSETYYGCYFLPGTPFDGWSMQVGGIQSNAYYTDGGYYNFPGGTLTGSVSGYTSVAGTKTGTWTGTAGLGSALQITQTNTLDTFASWLVVTTTFKNTSGATMPGLYYFVSADPDNDQPYPGGSFPTNNHIAFQGDFENRHEVWGKPPSVHQDAFSGLATKDCRAKAMIYQSWPPSRVIGNSLDLVWAETATSMGGTYYDLYHTTSSQDIAYALIYNLGDLPAGESTTLSYAWIFSDSMAIDSAFPRPQIITQGFAHDSLDTVVGCSIVGNFFPVDISHGLTRDWSLSTWTWSPGTGLSATTGTNVIVNLAALPGPTTYTITGVKDPLHGACGTRTFLLYVLPCFGATNNGPVCITDTLKLNAHGDSTGATYVWSGPLGFTASTQYTIRTGMTMADTGWYMVIRTVGSAHDTARTHVDLKPLPVVVATSNAPICSGPPNVLDLFATLFDPLETFTWTGPGAFNSILQNPTRPNPPVFYSGIYKLKTLLNGCADSGFVTVIIDTTPAVPTVGSNSPVCSGHRDTLKLTSSDVTPFVSYAWTGPAGFGSGLQNPIIPSPHVPASGTYTVTVSLSADGITCTNFNTVTVVVDSTPYPPAMGSNGPICSGTALNLSATSTLAATYNWTGPNGFTSPFQNPTINPATTFATGVYSVSATLGSCTSDTSTLMVVVDSTPQVPTASSNSPGIPSLCERDTLRLYANDGTAGVNYSWVGAASFTSTLQNPVIINVTPAATGNYTVTAILGMCSAATVITVSITPTPLLIATSNSPVCTGQTDTLFLEATSNPGATFTWTGPYVFTSTLQNPFRTPTIMEMDGVYQVIAYLNGCASLPVNDTITIRQTPPVPMVRNVTYCQFFDAPQLDAFGDSILWYTTSNFTSGTLTAPLPPTGMDTSMWFFVTQTRMGCMSAIDSFKVVVNPKPVLTLSPSVSVCPHDTVLLIAGDPDPITYYHWSPYLYISDSVGPFVVARPVTSQIYTVTAQNRWGCYDTAHVTLVVHPAAVLNLGDSLTLYPGESIQLNPGTNCNTFTWYPPAGLDNSRISNPIASPQISTKYIVHGETSWGCKAVDSINIYVNPETLLTVPNAFTPGSSVNNEFKIIKRGIAQLKYFRIWDRWGVKVFETSDINKGWDGTFNGKAQPFGVYIYEIGALTSTGREFLKHGNVTLVR